MKKIPLSLITTLILSAPYAQSMYQKNDDSKSVIHISLTKAEKLVFQMEQQVQKAQKYLQGALSRTLPENIALVLNIGDTCFLSKKSYMWFEANGINTVLDDIGNPYSFDEFRRPVINATLKLAQWAHQAGISIYYITSKIDKWPQAQMSKKTIDFMTEQNLLQKTDWYADLSLLYSYQLKSRGYPSPGEDKTFIICQQHDIYTTDYSELAQWQQSQLNKIKKDHPIIAYFDNNPQSVDQSISGQFVFPSVDIIK